MRDSTRDQPAKAFTPEKEAQMAFDFDQAAGDVTRERTLYNGEVKAARERIVELEHDFYQWSAVNDAKCGVSSSKNRLDFMIDGKTQISVVSNNDGTYHVECAAADTKTIQPLGGSVSNPMNEKEMLKAVMRWYRQLP